MVDIAIGFLLGCMFMRLLVRWGAIWRACCRRHYLTHATCSCADCERDREARRA